MIDGAWPAHPTSPFLDRVVAPRVARCRSKGGRKARVAELLQEHARLLYELHARSLFVFRSSARFFPHPATQEVCERVCDRAFFHTQGARAPRSKNRRPLDAKGTPLVAGHVVSANSIRQHSQSFDSALDSLVSRHGARRVDQIGCDTPCRQPKPLTCFASKLR